MKCINISKNLNFGKDADIMNNVKFTISQIFKRMRKYIIVIVSYYTCK